jgi:DEAD/DEAH box helicase domain-containing protein
MIPSVLSTQVRRGIDDFLRTTFPIHTPFFKGVMKRLLDVSSHDIFKGPYVSVKLPYTPGTHGRDYFPDVPLAFPPYLHQEQAFQRLSGNPAKSTLIATGTGSGKTEAFLYPILNHCLQKRGEPGIKAIVIYPMNALATDQARRFARIIHDNPTLNGTLRVGFYIGDRDGHAGSMMMTAEQVITNRDTMRLHPPDILLTNYKMLDYLMIRPADSPIWKENGTETLKYIVVDELHTFDGAQGTDLACLLRRLKARLKTPAGHLCCIGTSATLGGQEHADRLRNYAAQVLGEPFDTEAIITESVLEPQAFFDDTPIDISLEIPGPEHTADLDADNVANVQTYLRRQAALWFGMEHADIDSDAWRIELGRRLLSHRFFRNLIIMLSCRLSTMNEIAAELKKLHPVFETDDPYYPHHLLNSLLALISWARTPTPDGGRLHPFLQVRLQLWMRELRRMVCSVEKEPSIRFSDDLTPDQSRRHLPLIHCRECGETGWLGTMRQQDEHINPDLQHI